MAGQRIKLQPASRKGPRPLQPMVMGQCFLPASLEDKLLLEANDLQRVFLLSLNLFRRHIVVLVPEVVESG